MKSMRACAAGWAEQARGEEGFLRHQWSRGALLGSGGMAWLEGPLSISCPGQGFRQYPSELTLAAVWVP